eukprot:TRINITY_DN1625_c0_g7_i1.p2 TRINITY_DN1625_c0_g7~~TRINITY_DN1625_c0_g7_i1.p2  ORF type:complete len:137 (-),score=46.36 TRINITY_DN1625_c0_g7_i1:312-722(-)
MALFASIRSTALQFTRSVCRAVQPPTAVVPPPACGMKAMMEKDKYQRRRFARQELKQLALRTLTHNRYIDYATRSVVMKKLWRKTEMGRASCGRIHNRCIETNRGHSVLRDWKLSRIEFRNLARECELPGVHKASW